MRSTRMAVIGAGRLGSFHARLVDKVPGAKLVGVADPLRASRQRLAQECGVPAVDDYRKFLGNLEAAIIATPTQYHAEVALDLLQAGVHVLVEKPITSTSQQADQLIRAAQSAGVVLQVGHVERFNPAWSAVDVAAVAPRYIQTQRTSGYTCRSVDVGVVLDLMIHDLDLVLSLMDQDVVRVEACGASVFGPHEDLAFATVQFANGVLASLHASRVSQQGKREMRVWGGEGEVAIDFAQHRAERTCFGHALKQGTVEVANMSDEEKEHLQNRLFQDYLPHQTVSVEACNAILCEQVDFVEAIRLGGAPRVTGQQGRDALALAEQILSRIQSHCWSPGQTAPEADAAALAWPAQPLAPTLRRRAG